MPFDERTIPVHLRERVTPTRNPAAAELLSLAHQYREAAGHAFAKGDDATAVMFRDAAGKLTGLARKLPPLPAPVSR